MATKQPYPIKFKERVVAQLPDEFSHKEAKEVGLKFDIPPITIKDWGIKAGKVWRVSQPRSQSTTEVVEEEPRYMQVGDTVVIKNCLDNGEHVNKKGNVLSYSTRTKLYTVSVGDDICLADKLEKPVTRLSRLKKQKRSKHASSKEKRFIYDYHRTYPNLSQAMIGEKFGYAGNTLSLWFKNLDQNPYYYARYSEAEALEMAKKYGVVEDLHLVEPSVEAQPEANAPAEEEVVQVVEELKHTPSIVETLNLNKPEILTETLSQEYRLTDGELVIEATVASKEVAIKLPMVNSDWNSRGLYKFESRSQVVSLMNILSHLLTLIPEGEANDHSLPDDARANAV